MIWPVASRSMEIEAQEVDESLRQWFSLTTAGLFWAAVDKLRIALLVTNIRHEYALQEEEEDLF